MFHVKHRKENDGTNGLSSTITTEVRKKGRTGKAICPACTRAGLGDASWQRTS